MKPMKRSLLLLLLLVPLSADQRPPDEFGTKMIKFHAHYDKFFRAYFGCPSAENAKPMSCDARYSRFDRAEYLKAWKAAQELFPPAEK